MKKNDLWQILKQKSPADITRKDILSSNLNEPWEHGFKQLPIQHIAHFWDYFKEKNIWTIDDLFQMAINTSFNYQNEKKEDVLMSLIQSPINFSNKQWFKLIQHADLSKTNTKGENALHLFIKYRLSKAEVDTYYTTEIKNASLTPEQMIYFIENSDMNASNLENKTTTMLLLEHNILFDNPYDRKILMKAIQKSDLNIQDNIEQKNIFSYAIENNITQQLNKSDLLWIMNKSDLIYDNFDTAVFLNKEYKLEFSIKELVNIYEKSLSASINPFDYCFALIASSDDTSTQDLVDSFSHKLIGNIDRIHSDGSTICMTPLTFAIHCENLNATKALTYIGADLNKIDELYQEPNSFCLETFEKTIQDIKIETKSELEKLNLENNLIPNKKNTKRKPVL